MMKNTNRNQASLSWQLIFPKIAEKTKWKQYIVWTTNFGRSILKTEGMIRRIRYCTGVTPPRDRKLISDAVLLSKLLNQNHHFIRRMFFGAVKTP